MGRDRASELLRDGRSGPPRAVIFDFNGTLSRDEPIIFRILSDLFSEPGRPLLPEEYFGTLAGLSDAEIVRRVLGPDYPEVEQIVRERVARYLTVVSDGSTVPEGARAAVSYAAAKVPVGVVSSAVRREI